MSRRDLAHVMTALLKLSSGDPAVGVPVAKIDEAIGRGRDDMRTPLNLQSLSDEDLVVRLPNGTWALTPRGHRLARAGPRAVRPLRIGSRRSDRPRCPGALRGRAYGLGRERQRDMGLAERLA